MPQCEIQLGMMDHQGKRLGGRGLFIAGPLLPVEIGVTPQMATALTDAGRAIPKPQLGLILVDTGATTTSIDNSVVAALSLPPTGTTMLRHASGSQNTALHAVQMMFPVLAGFSVVLPQAINCNLGGMVFNQQPVIALFGRDLLGKIVMIYNGPQDRVSLIPI